LATYHIEDNFLNDYESFRSYCDSIDYDGLLNPADDVFYPGVSDDIGDDVRLFCEAKLSEMLGKPIKFEYFFLRLSVDGVDVPQAAHNDVAMGGYSFMLYMNRLDDCLGGTSFVIHNKTGLSTTPINEKQLSLWRRDCNDLDAWSITNMVDMMPNRALIFKSSDMHRALPVGGFGENKEDGRLVLTGFFND
jgi:hypothetical protein